MAPVKLFLVRHGQTEWNRLGKAQGHTDTELDEEGLHQSRRLADLLGEEPIDWVVTSDLRRSVSTAEALGKPLELDPDLRERSFGDWEGQPYEEVRELLRTIEHPPNGESFQQLWERLGLAADRLRMRTGNGLVVTHGGACAVLLAHLIGGTPEVSRGFRFSNTGVSCLHRRPDGSYVLIQYNDCRHLDRVALSGDLQGVHRT
ncbi:MAG: histidine phosphatase family protein [Fimbriimonadaceae bacterium]